MTKVTYLALFNAAVLAAVIVMNLTLLRNQRNLIAVQQDAIAKQTIAIAVWRNRALTCEAGGDLVSYRP